MDTWESKEHKSLGKPGVAWPWHRDDHAMNHIYFQLSGWKTGVYLFLWRDDPACLTFLISLGLSCEHKDLVPSAGDMSPKEMPLLLLGNNSNVAPSTHTLMFPWWSDGTVRLRFGEQNLKLRQPCIAWVWIPRGTWGRQWLSEEYGQRTLSLARASNCAQRIGSAKEDQLLRTALTFSSRSFTVIKESTFFQDLVSKKKANLNFPFLWLRVGILSAHSLLTSQVSGEKSWCSDHRGDFISARVKEVHSSPCFQNSSPFLIHLLARDAQEPSALSKKALGLGKICWETDDVMQIPNSA